MVQVQKTIVDILAMYTQPDIPATGTEAELNDGVSYTYSIASNYPCSLPQYYFSLQTGILSYSELRYIM